MKTLILLIAISLFSGCASMLPISHEPQEITVTQKSVIWPAVATVEFINKEARQDKENNKDLSYRAISDSAKLEPKKVNFGLINIKYKANGVITNSAKKVEYVIVKDGKEIYRSIPSYRAFNVSALRGEWLDSDYVITQRDVQAPFTFAVIDHITQKRDIFTITK